MGDASQPAHSDELLVQTNFLGKKPKNLAKSLPGYFHRLCPIGSDFLLFLNSGDFQRLLGLGKNCLVHKYLSNAIDPLSGLSLPREWRVCSIHVFRRY